jgi:hypothetical protein
MHCSYCLNCGVKSYDVIILTRAQNGEQYNYNPELVSWNVQSRASSRYLEYKTYVGSTITKFYLLSQYQVHDACVVPIPTYFPTTP